MADPAAMLDLLRTSWFFGDEHLRRAAADLELAQVRFTVTLAPIWGAGSSRRKVARSSFRRRDAAMTEAEARAAFAPKRVVPHRRGVA